VAGSPEETANPWLLLNRSFSDGAIPAVVDANSLSYILHLKLGDDFTFSRSEGSKIQFRVVAALADSLFQGEMLISEANFTKLFPEQQGYRFLLIDAPPGALAPLSDLLEDRLSNFGLDVSTTAERIRRYHEVENTYLSTFQSLGGLGLVLGCLGLVAVLLRNILENSRQLALLKAVGFTPRHLMIMVASENIIVLFLGLSVGTLCAMLAIIPAVLNRGGHFPWHGFIWLLPSVLLTGIISSAFVAYTLLRIPLVSVLKVE